MLPHKSGSHEAANGRTKPVWVPEALPTIAPVVPTEDAPPPPLPDAVTEGLVETVGNSAERACPTAAFA